MTGFIKFKEFLKLFMKKYKYIYINKDILQNIMNLYFQM